mmetsp:Transcript_6936/g.16376  ORF Transcript_6936/g.16376 Transcript_6936/m.16376 type:complete len:80 (+) Transcript_6936:401-640(+)
MELNAVMAARLLGWVGVLSGIALADEACIQTRRIAETRTHTLAISTSPHIHSTPTQQTDATHMRAQTHHITHTHTHTHA